MLHAVASGENKCAQHNKMGPVANAGMSVRQNPQQAGGGGGWRFLAGLWQICALVRSMVLICKQGQRLLQFSMEEPTFSQLPPWKNLTAVNISHPDVVM